MVNKYQSNIWSEEVALNMNASQEILEGISLSLVAPVMANIETTVQNSALS